jgi:hypothetical protein
VNSITAAQIGEIREFVFEWTPKLHRHKVIFVSEPEQLCIPFDVDAKFPQGVDKKTLVNVLGEAQNKWEWTDGTAGI